MIVYRLYKHPTQKIFLNGRMRKLRCRHTHNIRAIANWLKRRKRW
jgi:hypothetical protein